MTKLIIPRPLDARCPRRADRSGECDAGSRQTGMRGHAWMLADGNVSTGADMPCREPLRRFHLELAIGGTTRQPNTAVT
jgi:hypothetical protein